MDRPCDELGSILKMAACFLVNRRVAEANAAAQLFPCASVSGVLSRPGPPMPAGPGSRTLHGHNVRPRMRPFKSSRPPAAIHTCTAPRSTAVAI